MAQLDINSSSTPELFEDQPDFMRFLRIEDRLYRFVLIRFLVVLALVPGAYFAHHIVGIEGLSITGFAILALILGLCNTITLFIVLPFHRDHNRAKTHRRFLVGMRHATILVDFLCLTAALWLVGGAQSPFQAFFLFHVIISSILLSPKEAYAHAFLGYFLLTLLILGTWLEWIPHHYPEGAVPFEGPLSGRYILTVLVVQGLLFSLTALLCTHLMKLMRAGGLQLIETNRQLDRVAKLRRDFLHITLHNLRSPVGAIGMHISNLQDGYAGELNKQQLAWIDRCQHRIAELSAFLHDLEYLTVLESADLEEHLEAVDLRPMLQALVEENQDLAQEHNHTFTLSLDEQPHHVRGVSRLIREAIVNYITNAIKYTPSGGTITVRALDKGKFVRIEVQDNGIGISPESQKRLFEEFVRIPRDDTEVAKASGSGLGLYIVRQIADVLGGRIDVQSNLNQGSTFALEIPKAP